MTGEHRDSHDARRIDDEAPGSGSDNAGAGGSENRPGRHRARARDTDEPVLPTISRDETDVGWGDEPRERDEDWYRRERPPHHE